MNNESSPQNQRAARRHAFTLFQALTLLLIVAWLLADPAAERTFAQMLRSVENLADWQALRSTMNRARSIGLLSIVGLAGISMAWELGRAMRRRWPKFTIGRLLMLTFFVAMWLWIAIDHDRIAWHGKQLRSITRIDALDRLALRLSRDWPSDAGEIEGLGPFTAYPFDKPQLLMLLTPYPFESTDTVITAIEKSEDGTMRFELGGDEVGDWIEWHPSGQIPRDFSGGLAQDYQLKRYAQLEDGWYLARYGNATPSP